MSKGVMPMTTGSQVKPLKKWAVGPGSYEKGEDYTG